MVPRRLLRLSGLHAEIDEDALIDGAYILSIGGAQQSHVNLAAPQEVFYEYLRRIANLVDLVAPAGQPIRALHLGAGALTLARYIAVTRPGSVQHAVERERELNDFVLQHLPLPPEADVRHHIADAREVLEEFDAGSFDVVVLDVFAGPDSPAHLTGPDFYAEAAAVLDPNGMLVVNVGDEPPLTFTRSQVRALEEVMDDVGALADRSMFTARYPGNIVLAGLKRPWPAEWDEPLLAAGPHPAAVRTGTALDRLR